MRWFGAGKPLPSIEIAWAVHIFLSTQTGRFVEGSGFPHSIKLGIL